MSRRSVHIKVCGLTRREDVYACISAGVDWMGLNFHPTSPRGISRDVAAQLLSDLPPSITPVGLFVDRPAHEVAEYAADLSLPVVQLHGHEPPEDLLALGHLQIIRAFRLGDTASIQALTDYLARASALGRAPDYVLVDAHVANLPGGTGQSIPDRLLRLLPPHSRLILAGGLTPENVAERIQLARPWMVDVASGVESSPGIKDAARIKAFVDAVDNAHPESPMP